VDDNRFAVEEWSVRCYLSFRGENMTTAQTIAQHLNALPISAQREVLDFVEFLEARRRDRTVREEDVSWTDFSLAAAMRGMEDENSPYTVADLKESFR
jgi:hypothetical protein